MIFGKELTLYEQLGLEWFKKNISNVANLFQENAPIQVEKSFDYLFTNTTFKKDIKGFVQQTVLCKPEFNTGKVECPEKTQKEESPEEMDVENSDREHSDEKSDESDDEEIEKEVLQEMEQQSIRSNGISLKLILSYDSSFGEDEAYCTCDGRQGYF